MSPNTTRSKRERVTAKICGTERFWNDTCFRTRHPWAVTGVIKKTRLYRHSIPKVATPSLSNRSLPILVTKLLTFKQQKYLRHHPFTVFGRHALTWVLNLQSPLFLKPSVHRSVCPRILRLSFAPCVPKKQNGQSVKVDATHHGNWYSSSNHSRWFNNHDTNTQRKTQQKAQVGNETTK